MSQMFTNVTTPSRFSCNYCLALQPSISTAIIFIILYAFPLTLPFRQINVCSVLCDSVEFLVLVRQCMMAEPSGDCIITK